MSTFRDFITERNSELKEIYKIVKNEGEEVTLGKKAVFIEYEDEVTMGDMEKIEEMLDDKGVLFISVERGKKVALKYGAKDDIDINPNETGAYENVITIY